MGNINVFNICLTLLIVIINGVSIVCRKKLSPQSKMVNVRKADFREFPYIVSLGELNRGSCVYAKEGNEVKSGGGSMIEGDSDGDDRGGNRSIRDKSKFVDRRWPGWIHWCHGVIIHQRWILTAKSCEWHANWNVMLTVDDLLDSPRNLLFTMEYRFGHPDASSSHHQSDRNDLALVRLMKPITKLIEPVKLALREYPIGIKSVIAGWISKKRGRIQSDKMLKFDSKTFHPRNCHRNDKFFNVSQNLCGPPGPCIANIAAPMIIKGPTKSEDIVQGILSRPSAYRRRSQRCHFVNVRNYIPWIKDTLARYGDEIRPYIY